MNTRWHIWAYLFSFFLLTAICTALFGGVLLLHDYHRIIEPNLKINKENLHFFTREFIHRRFVKLTTNNTESQLPVFSLYADEIDLESLQENLPNSGKKRYISGHLSIDNENFSSAIEFRYRGGLPLHWFYQKKSFRVKLPRFINYHGSSRFNLVNPSTIHTVTDWVSYDMSRTLGLITPDFFPVRVTINNETNGLHYFLSQTDESLLRKNHRMPGSIYSGDTISVDDPLGMGIDAHEMMFKDVDNTPMLWHEERLWSKDASRNSESASDRRDIQKFINVINEEDPIEFMQDFETYFDKQKYYLYWGLDTLVGGFHHDNFHNHKMYFDPYKGKFEPIEWDIRFWKGLLAAKDLLEYPLLRQVKLNPILEHERDVIAYQLLKRFPADQVSSNIQKMSTVTEQELLTDPARQAAYKKFPQFDRDKDQSFSMKQYRAAIEDLKRVYKRRNAYLEKVFKNSSAFYTLSQMGDEVALTVSISGNSSVNFNPWQLIPENSRHKTTINRFHKDTIKPISATDIEQLYPGRQIKSGNTIGRKDNWAIAAFGKDHLISSPIQYKYRIKSIDLTDLNEHADLKAENVITGDSVLVKYAAELPSIDDTASVHPWSLSTGLSLQAEQITLSGEISVNEDMIFESHQTVTILPGTMFKLHRGKSLFFYGKVIADGTVDLPIRFEPYTKGQPWGSIVIQGKKASGSQLHHIHVSGGSITNHRLIDYPGELNIHDVDLFELTHCVIKNNQIGDDALHVSYSNGTISNCLFQNTAFDALDMDIVDVTVLSSTFTNIGNDALDLMTSIVEINHVTIDGAGDKCFSIGEESTVSIYNSKLDRCTIGIAVKDQSKAYIENLDFASFQEEAISLYRKNSRYNYGGTIDGKQLNGLNKNDIKVGSWSTNNLLFKN